MDDHRYRSRREASPDFVDVNASDFFNAPLRSLGMQSPPQWCDLYFKSNVLHNCLLATSGRSHLCCEDFYAAEVCCTFSTHQSC
jgi:hypothetical protein